MPTNTKCLSPDEVRVFLDGGLSQAHDSTVIEHLDGCVRCRAALEESVGGADWLHDVRHFLADTTPIAQADERSDEPADNESADNDAVNLRARLVADRLTFLAPSDDPRMLGRIGLYEVTGVVGYGAMGIVLKAFEPSLNRYVALKALWPHLAINGAARQRFAREARAAAAVVHEHVVPIYSVDEFQGLPYIVLRYVPGRSLHERIAQQGQLQLDEALRIARQIATALDAAHAQGIVHRDVKPANILLENGVERVLVTDFGLARVADDASMTHSSLVVGTPQFMAPEQARGSAVDGRGDLFSLGSVLYTMLAGHPPFRAETMVGVLTRICSDDARPLREINPAVPEWLAALVAKLMAKDPARRFQSAAEVAKVLEQELAHLQNPLSAARPDRRWARRPWSPRAVIGGALGGVAVIALACALWPRLFPDSTDDGVNRGAGGSAASAAVQAEYWRGNADEFSELSRQADRLERSIWPDGDQPSAGPSESKLLDGELLRLEHELGQEATEWPQVIIDSEP